MMGKDSVTKYSVALFIFILSMYLFFQLMHFGYNYSLTTKYNKNQDYVDLIRTKPQEEHDLTSRNSLCSKLYLYKERNIETEYNKPLFNLCRKFSMNKNEISDQEDIDHCKEIRPRFLEVQKPLVALASFPGSGNSWVRELLEALTGIYTGSAYSDIKGYFDGSKRCPSDGSVYIIKTHKIDGELESTSRCKSQVNILYYTKVILIIRNPYDSLIAEFNRKNGGKVGFATKEAFRSPDWRSEIELTIPLWADLFTSWLKDFKGPHHLLIYEKLKPNLHEELKNLAKFLGQNVTDSSVDCIVRQRNKQSKYHRGARPYWQNKNELFNDDLRRMTNREIYNVIQAFENRPDIISTVQNYIL